MNGLAANCFLYKKRFRRARDMPSLYTFAWVGASLAGNFVSAARFAALANAR